MTPTAGSSSSRRRIRLCAMCRGLTTRSSLLCWSKSARRCWSALSAASRRVRPTTTSGKASAGQPSPVRSTLTRYAMRLKRRESDPYRTTRCSRFTRSGIWDGMTACPSCSCSVCSTSSWSLTSSKTRTRSTIGTSRQSRRRSTTSASATSRTTHRTSRRCSQTTRTGRSARWG